MFACYYMHSDEPWVTLPSRSPDGMFLLCCSWDGSLAFVGFTEKELGTPMSAQQKVSGEAQTAGK